MNALFEQPVISPTKIESALFQAAAASRGLKRPDGTPVVKSSLANFIILADTTGGVETEKLLSGLIESFCVQHPSRFFVLQFDSSAAYADKLDAAVNSRQVKLESGISISSEEIYLRVGTNRAGNIKNLLLSLYVPDVEIIVLAMSPSIVTSRGEFFPVFQEIVSSADKVIYDSEYVPKGFVREPLCRLSSLHGLRPVDDQGNGVWDLSWMRTRRWRGLIAESFESPELLEALPRLQSLTISESVSAAYAKCPESFTESMLLGGWVLSRLGIGAESVNCEEKLKDPAKGGDWRFRVSYGEGSFNLVLNRSGSAVAKDGAMLTSTSFKFSGGKELNLTRDPSKSEAAIIFEDETRVVPFAFQSFDRLVLSAVSAGRDSERYQSAYGLALRMSSLCS